MVFESLSRIGVSTCSIAVLRPRIAEPLLVRASRGRFPVGLVGKFEVLSVALGSVGGTGARGAPRK